MRPPEEHPFRQLNRERAAATHCINGHAFAAPNGYRYTSPRGQSRRVCRACCRINSLTDRVAREGLTGRWGPR